MKEQLNITNYQTIHKTMKHQLKTSSDDPESVSTKEEQPSLETHKNRLKHNSKDTLASDKKDNTTETSTTKIKLTLQKT